MPATRISGTIVVALTFRSVLGASHSGRNSSSFHSEGKAPSKQQQDRFECHQWAVDMRSWIILEVKTHCRKLEEAKMRLRVATLALTVGRGRLQVTTTRFGGGSTLLGDVLQSQAAVAAVHDQYQLLFRPTGRRAPSSIER